jgi:deoxyribonuclease-1
MPYAFSLLATLLAACTSAPPLLPVRTTTERPGPVDQAKPAKVTAASRVAASGQPLVYSKKAVGHRDFAGAKKVLPSVFAGMEVDFLGAHTPAKPSI